MLESLKTSELEYQKLSPEEMEKRGILGRLIGPCADFICPTRNGRKYGQDLWEKVFADPIMKERIENGVCFGELNHPLDGREETDIEKAAVCLAEVPKKGKNGKLMAVFDILSTPAGKILKALCDYGSVLGVSSRGSGDTFTDYDGQESVDPETYTCEGFDIVTIPAVKDARLTYVTESLNTKKTLRESLDELVDSATDEGRRIMKEVISTLNIELGEKESTPVKEVVDNNSNIVEELKEALKQNKELQREVSALQEKLSVSYTKEASQKELVEKYRASLDKFISSLKKSSLLEGRIAELQDELVELKKEIVSQKSVIKRLNENNSSSKQHQRSLNESLKERDDQLDALKSKCASLQESFSSQKEKNQKVVDKLTEQLEDFRKDIKIKDLQYTSKLEESNNAILKYKKIAKAAVDRYIESKASLLGLKSAEIKNRLSEGYSFNEIDSVCESLREYRLNMSKLPFDVGKASKVQVTKAKEPILKESITSDDEIDDQLLRMAGFNN